MTTVAVWLFFPSTSQMSPITYLTPFAPVITAYRAYAVSVVLQTLFSLLFLRRIKDLFHWLLIVNVTHQMLYSRGSSGEFHLTLSFPEEDTKVRKET